MSDSRVSSVIQEWAYPGQAHPHPHPQTLNPNTSNHAGLTNHLAQIDMMPYGQSHGMRGASDDRVTEQMMGLSYLPYNSSCLSNASGAESASQHQSQVNTQQVCVCDLIIIITSPPTLTPIPKFIYHDNNLFFLFFFFRDLNIIVVLTSRTSLPSSCQLCGPR